MSQQNQSEVAQLKRQIVEEYESAQRGLEGLSLGAAQHQFITKRIENMQYCHKQLITLVGQEQASAILAEVWL